MDTLRVCRLALGAVGSEGIASVAGASVGCGAAAAGGGVSVVEEFVCGCRMPLCVCWLAAGSAGHVGGVAKVAVG